MPARKKPPAKNLDDYRLFLPESRVNAPCAGDLTNQPARSTEKASALIAGRINRDFRKAFTRSHVLS
jgi:hypothetical protein